ncbi:MAG: VOC family protein [Candidatus Acidiferrales bacterium]
MAKLSLSEQLDRAVQAVLAPAAGEQRRDGAVLDERIAPLARLAEQLRGLPREDFKARLKAEFEGSATMASKPAVATEQGSTAITQREKTSGASESYIPAGYKTITPYLTAPNAPELIDFIKETFGAEETFRTTGAAGGVHCELRVGNSMVMVGGSVPGKPFVGVASPTTLHVYTQDCDATYARALEAGATSIAEPNDQPYGERLAEVKDASGNIWRISFPTYLGEKPYKPESVQSVQVYLHVNGAASLINFMKRALGAQEMEGRATSPEGLIWHSTIKIGSSQLEISDAMERYQLRPSKFYLYVDDADAWYRRALDAGASSDKAPVNQPYGDRVGSVKDPAGNLWYLSTHLETPEAKAPAASAENSAAPVKYIREGFHTVTPYLLARNAARLIDFLKEGLGAQERFRVPTGERIMHAEVQIGDSIVELSDGSEEFPSRGAMHILFVDDVDASYRRALDAGATSLYEPVEQVWGDRDAGVQDPSGNNWYLTARRLSEHVPADTPTIVPGFSTRGADRFIEFMKQAFGAEEAFMHKSPTGTVIHSRIRIGDSILAVGELRGDFVAMPFHLHMYVPDVDAVYARAIAAAAGVKTLRAPKDEPYGDRAATVEDTFGNLWSFATHIKDVKF